AAVLRALGAPLNYPPLDVSIVPGDRVAIAVDANVPCAVEIVRGTLAALTHAGVASGAVPAVVSSSELAQLFRKKLPDVESGGVQIVLHDPDDDANLCFI